MALFNVAQGEFIVFDEGVNPEDKVDIMVKEHDYQGYNYTGVILPLQEARLLVDNLNNYGKEILLGLKDLWEFETRDC